MAVLLKKANNVSNLYTGQIVFLTAFLKKDPKAVFICRGKIKQCPKEKERQIYKVEIIAVGAIPTVGATNKDPKSLLGINVTKKANELHKDMHQAFLPKKWIE